MKEEEDAGVLWLRVIELLIFLQQLLFTSRTKKNAAIKAKERKRRNLITLKQNGRHSNGFFVGCRVKMILCNVLQHFVGS